MNSSRTPTVPPSETHTRAPPRRSERRPCAAGRGSAPQRRPLFLAGAFFDTLFFTGAPFLAAAFFTGAFVTAAFFAGAFPAAAFFGAPFFAGAAFFEDAPVFAGAALDRKSVV